jgi:probable HAF family extracellular repeat protein
MTAGALVRLAIAILLLSAAEPAAAASRYRAIELGILPGTNSNTSAFSINEAGQIVGASWTPDGDYHACLWENGTITDLGTLPGYSGSSAYAINEAGQIVGSSGTGGSDDHWHACLWEDGTITDLGTLPGAERSAAYGVNNSGQIVGWSDVEPFGQHACLWEDGTITDLGTLSASPWECNCSIAEDISDLGQIVGSSGSASGFPRACLWQRAISFPDVSGDFWAYDEIMACVDAKVVNGYEDGLYHPEYEVTRDQMAVYIARALVIPSGDAGIPDGPATPTFPDVPANHWAYKQIEYAVSQGVVQGYEDGTYHPEYEVTRDQMAVYVARSMVAPTGEAALADYVPADPRNFPDVPSEFWAWKHVEYCVENGVVQGYEDGLYHPEIVVTRDQMAVYVARAFGLAM